jgi:hypothetical protein
MAAADVLRCSRTPKLKTAAGIFYSGWKRAMIIGNTQCKYLWCCAASPMTTRDEHRTQHAGRARIK